MPAQRGGRIVVRGGATPGRTFRDADRCRHRRWRRTGDRSHVGRRSDLGRAERAAVATARVVMRRVFRRAEDLDLVRRIRLVRLADLVLVRRRFRGMEIMLRGVAGGESVIGPMRRARRRLRRGGQMFVVRATADDGMPKHARGGDEGGGSTQHERVDRAGAAELRRFSTYTDRRGEAQYRPDSGAASSRIANRKND